MLGKNMLTSRQIKLETRRIRCDNCNEKCKVYDIEDFANGKLARLKCPRCNWYTEGKVFLKDYNIPLQIRQRVTRLPMQDAIEKKENREEHLRHYSPFQIETPMVSVFKDLSQAISIKEVRRQRRARLKRLGLSD